jgi:hypothetical protein
MPSSSARCPVLAFLLVFVASLSLGCKTSQEDRAKQALVDASTPVCTSDKRCDEMWQAAQLWVRQHGAAQEERFDPARSATAQTNMNASQILMSVRQTPAASGFRFDFRGRCLNFPRCRPSVLDEHLRFNQFMNGAYPPPPPDSAEL